MTRSAIGLAAAFVCGISAYADEPLVSEKGLDGFISIDRLPMPDDPILQSGRLVWDDTCGNCHGGNKATGAPKITSKTCLGPSHRARDGRSH